MDKVVLRLSVCLSRAQNSRLAINANSMTLRDLQNGTALGNKAVIQTKVSLKVILRLLLALRPVCVERYYFNTPETTISAAPEARTIIIAR